MGRFLKELTTFNKLSNLDQFLDLTTFKKLSNLDQFLDLTTFKKLSNLDQFRFDNFRKVVKSGTSDLFSSPSVKAATSEGNYQNFREPYHDYISQS